MSSLYISGWVQNATSFSLPFVIQCTYPNVSSHSCLHVITSSVSHVLPVTRDTGTDRQRVTRSGTRIERYFRCWTVDKIQQCCPHQSLLCVFIPLRTNYPEFTVFHPFTENQQQNRLHTLVNYHLRHKIWNRLMYHLNKRFTILEYCEPIDVLRFI